MLTNWSYCAFHQQLRILIQGLYLWCSKLFIPWVLYISGSHTATKCWPRFKTTTFLKLYMRTHTHTHVHAWHTHVHAWHTHACTRKYGFSLKVIGYGDFPVRATLYRLTADKNIEPWKWIQLMHVVYNEHIIVVLLWYHNTIYTQWLYNVFIVQS